MKRNKAAIALLGLSSVMLAGVVALGGCAPKAQGTTEEEPSDSATEAIVSPVTTDPETDPLNPVVKKLSDGTVIQRTPSEDLSASWDASALTHHPVNQVPHNTYYTNADAKGCNACHEDLGTTVENLGMDHPGTLRNNLGLEVTVQMCLDCHDHDGGSQTVDYSFGTAIHGIHEKAGVDGCMNCHDATEDGQGMALWDLVKYDRLWGISSIADVDMSGEFTWSQDETTPMEGMYDVIWQIDDSHYARMENKDEEISADNSVYDEWVITVTGEVNEEKSWTLSELIAEAPSVTTPLKSHCRENVNGGPWIAQPTITGIPISWILEQAGVKDAGTFLRMNTVEGPQVGFGKISLSRLENNEGYLVYQMDGQPLDWSQGYPCTTIIGGTGALAGCKNVTEFCVVTEPMKEDYCMRNYDGEAINKPSAGIMHLREGQVFQTGETVDFHGYVDAFDEVVTGVEISMDKGATWTRFDISGANTDQWVTWNYAFTPESAGSYVFYVRGVAGDATGHVSKIMVTVKDEIPEV